VTANRVTLEGTNRNGRSVAHVIEGEALAKHRLHRARKGTLVGSRVKPTGFARTP
jgi:hypothetical protein